MEKTAKQTANVPWLLHIDRPGFKVDSILLEVQYLLNGTVAWTGALPRSTGVYV